MNALFHSRRLEDLDRLLASDPQALTRDEADVLESAFLEFFEQGIHPDECVVEAVRQMWIDYRPLGAYTWVAAAG